MTHLGRQHRCNGGVPRAPPRWENGNYSGSAAQLFIYLFSFQVWNSTFESFEVNAHTSEEGKEDLRALGYRLENEFGFVVSCGPCQDVAKQEAECGFSQRCAWEEGKWDCWGDERFELLRHIVLSEKIRDLKIYKVYKPLGFCFSVQKNVSYGNKILGGQGTPISKDVSALHTLKYRAHNLPWAHTSHPRLFTHIRLFRWLSKPFATGRLKEMSSAFKAVSGGTPAKMFSPGLCTDMLEKKIWILQRKMWFCLIWQRTEDLSKIR